MKMSIACFLLVTLFCYSHQLGGWQTFQTSDSQAQKAAHFAVQQISDSTNSTFALKLIRAKSVYYQIVAGINYKMVVDAGLTSCRKGTHLQLPECQWNSNATGNTAVKCSVTVYLDLKGKYHLSKSKCKDETMEAALGLGWKLVSSRDQGVQEASLYAIRNFSEKTDSKYSLKVIEVSSAERQVDLGVNYRISVTAALTTCLKTQKLHLYECKYNAKNVGYKCEFQVHRGLSSRFFLTKSSCKAKNLVELLGKQSLIRLVPRAWVKLSDAQYHVHVVAKLAVKAISKDEDFPNMMVFSDVLMAKSKVVDGGVRFEMVIDFGKSNCQKGFITELALCTFLSDKKRTRCNVSLMYIPWHFKVENVKATNCHPVSIV